MFNRKPTIIATIFIVVMCINSATTALSNPSTMEIYESKRKTISNTMGRNRKDVGIMERQGVYEMD